MGNIIIKREFSSIGSMSAEDDDEFLEKCFVDNDAIKELKQAGNKILLGRTGAGKTAILEKIKNTKSDSVDIDIYSISLQYIDKFDILNFLFNRDVELTNLFVALWQHIFVLEYIRKRFGLINEEQERTKIENLINWVKNRYNKSKYSKAIEYFEKWRGRFFNSVDKNEEEILRRLEHAVKGEVKSNLTVDGFGVNSNIGSLISEENRDSDEYRALLQRKVDNFVNDQLFIEMSDVINTLNEYDKSNKCILIYLLIDKLDEEWADLRIRFLMILALIFSLNKMKKLEKMKIIVALRNDIIIRIFDEFKRKIPQREKIKDLFVEILWNKEKLIEIIDTRINYLFKYRYTKDNVYLKDLVEDKKIEIYDYIIDRSLYRPRDVIDFVNQILKVMANMNYTSINSDVLYTAEKNYSKNRLMALTDEWKTIHVWLESVINIFKQKNIVDINYEIFKKIYDDLVLQILLDIPEDKTIFKDKIIIMCEEIIKDNIEELKHEILKKELYINIMTRLYHIGLIEKDDANYDLITDVMGVDNIKIDEKFKIRNMYINEFI